jgi:hypothetical protein
MPVRKPINYALKPDFVDQGLTWVNLNLESFVHGRD